MLTNDSILILSVVANVVLVILSLYQLNVDLLFRDIIKKLQIENDKLREAPASLTVDEMTNKIADLESYIWQLEEQRDLMLETIDRAGIKPADLGDQEQPRFSDLIELVIEEDIDHPTDEQYASMAESLAEKREMEADRLKDDKAEKHIEEDCDQCNQDGPEKCEVNMELSNKNPDWVEQYDLGAVDTGKKY